MFATLSVVVVLQGPSASGKSTLMAGMNSRIRECGLDLDVDIPVRYTTRSRREQETFDKENCHLLPAEFKQLVQAGELEVVWGRPTSLDGRGNRYGFRLKDYLGAGKLVVLSANNYLDWRRDPLLLSLRRNNRLYTVRVVATRATREQRLERRRPLLEIEELGLRLQDVPADDLAPAHFVIPNDKPDQPFAVSQFCQVLGFIQLLSRHDAVPQNGEGQRITGRLSLAGP